MDPEQESRWLAAQGIAVGVDLVPAALRQLEFLAAVDRRRWLYEGPLLDRAIHRYKACWLPLLAKHTEAAVVDGPLVVPLDCEWIWHCHRLNPVQYKKDCDRLYGRILDSDNVKPSIGTKCKHQAEKVWTELYPGEPFELEHTSPSDNSIYANTGTSGDISYDLVSAVKRQTSFCYQVGTPTMHDRRFLEEALARYKGFLYVIKTNKEKGMNLFRVPTYDVDLMWHTHQLHPVSYCNDMLKLLGKVLEHDDTDDDRSEGQKLDVGFSGTTKQFENMFGVRYWKAGAMYRGKSPSPVAFIPQIFSCEHGNGFGVSKAENNISIIETTVIELFLQIVDIKNLPSAIQKESVYVWFTKDQPDAFISEGGRLDISTQPGKTIGAGLQCEPTDELVLTVMVDRLSSSKKSEPIGKVSISLEEFAQPESKLSFVRWFELKNRGGIASSSPISLRVAASSTVPKRAPQVLSMINMEPFYLKTCLLPPFIKDQNTSCWTRFVYDSGVELIRLQTREHKAKNGMALVTELIGETKSSKKPFQLAESKENKWSFNNSTLSITEDLKPGQDGCILELKDDDKLIIKLYSGRRLEYERKCCSHHAGDASVVTAVKFTPEHPYGKAVALLDTESELIMVDEDWFLLPWITISFLVQNVVGKDGEKLLKGAMAQKGAVSESDAALVPETVTVGVADAAQGGNCGPACGVPAVAAGGGGNGPAESAGCGSGCGGGGCGNIVIGGSKVGTTKSGGCGGACGGSCGGMVIERTKAGIAKSGGCGSGCGGACGPVALESSKVGSAGSGSGCGGGCSAMVIEGSKTSHAMSGSCGSGCGGSCGSMVIEGSKTSHSKSGGGGVCGSVIIEGSKTGHGKSGGCGSGCGGGCSAMVIEGSKTSHGKSGGCGSGCGGGCSAVVIEGSKISHGKSGGCGSGCGGGCGGMVVEGFNTSHTKSGGCGSGCGGGCGSVIIQSSENSHGKSGGCGSGCGGGCGGGTMFNASAEGSHTRSGGCGAGCGGGCSGTLN